jgi:hypothetical protein
MLSGKLAVKVVQTLLILLVAAGLVYRGNTYMDGTSMSLLPVVMCGLLATFLTLTAVVVLLHEGHDGVELD